MCAEAKGRWSSSNCLGPSLLVQKACSRDPRSSPSPQENAALMCAPDAVLAHLVQVLGRSSRPLLDGVMEPFCRADASEQLVVLSAFAGVRVKQEDSASSKDKRAGDHRSDPSPARLKALSVRFPAAPIKASGSGHSPAAALVFVLRVEAFHPDIVVSRLWSKLRFGGGSVSCGARSMKHK